MKIRHFPPIFLASFLVMTVTGAVLAAGFFLPDKNIYILAIPPGLGLALFTWYYPDVIALILVALIPLDTFACLPGAIKQISLFKVLFPLPLFILFLGVVFRRFESPQPHPMDKWVFLWVILNLFLVAFSVDKVVALDFCRRFISMSLLYYLLTRIFCTPAKYRMLKQTIIFSTALSVMIGLFAYFGGANPFSSHQDPNLLRTTGATGMDPNSYAVSLFLPMWLAVASALSYRKISHSAFYFMIALIISSGIMLTFSRSAFMVFAIMFFFALIIWRKRLTPVHWGILLAGLVIFAMFLPHSFWERIASLGQFFSGEVSDYSLWRRENYLAVGWNIIKEYPFFGAGPGNFPVLHADPAFQPDRSLVGVERLPHNLYLQVITETGIVGLIFFCGAIGSTAITIRRGMKQGENEGALAGALLLTLIGFLMIGLFLHILLDKFLWLAFALIRIMPGVIKWQSQQSPAS